MLEFLQYLVLGLLLGGVYALAASGLTLVFGVMRIINIAHGAFLILAAFMAFTVWSSWGSTRCSRSSSSPRWFALGWVIYKVALAPVRTAPMASTVLLTFGLALVLEATMGVIWGNNATSTEPGYGSESLRIGSFYMPKAQVFGGAVAVRYCCCSA